MDGHQKNMGVNEPKPVIDRLIVRSERAGKRIKYRAGQLDESFVKSKSKSLKERNVK